MVNSSSFMSHKNIVFTDYFIYRCKVRNFNESLAENILRFGTERYYDTETHRKVVVGHHDTQLVLIPYEEERNEIRPVTIHAISRKQIRFRLSTGRFII